MTRYMRWLIVLVGFTAVALCLYVSRGRLKCALIAISIYRSHIFTPPPLTSGESRWLRLQHDTRFYWDFAEIPVARARRLELLNPTLQPLVKEIGRRQALGEDMQYSMHIYREIRWLLNFTPDTDAIRVRISDLRQSLTQPKMQKLASAQEPSDGSWGAGLNIWYLKLYYSVDEVEQCKGLPQYPLSFLDRVNSPAKLDTLLDSDLHDDFTKTGVFNREELDETFSAMARLLSESTPAGCYTFHPQLREALKTFVEGWQNPVTGCFGQWMVDRQGRVWKMDDMGITFHVVSDLYGQVKHQDRIARRLLQLDSVNFPAGIRFNGHYENHLNMDAVKIFRSAWPILDEASRQQVRAEISRMIDWCLAESYQSNGSFKVSDLDDTPGDAYRYGVWFLQEAGYFKREDRFWTNQEFPQSDTVRNHLEAKLKAMGLNDSALREAYETLRATK